MDFTRPLISKSLQQNLYNCIQRTNHNWCHCHFHVPYFFSPLKRSMYLTFFFLLSLSIMQWSVVSPKSTIQQVLFFCPRLPVVLLRWDNAFVTENQNGICVSHFPGQYLSNVYIYIYIFVWSKFNFYYNSPSPSIHVPSSNLFVVSHCIALFY